MKTISRIAKKLKRLFKDEAANVSVLTGLAVIPMFLAAGAAVDTVRINREQATFQGAVDSAVLAVASDNRAAVGGMSGTALQTRIAELEALARSFLVANYSPESGNAGAVSISVTVNNQAVQIHATNQFPTTIMKLAGVNSVTLDAFAEVRKAMRPVEVVMVMDTTGSMGSSGKIEGARSAAHTLMDTLYGGNLAAVPDSEYIRTALVPFATNVRLNQNAYDFNMGWIDTAGLNPLSRRNFVGNTLNSFTAWSGLKNSSNNVAMSWNGCVEARMGNDRTSDTAPTSLTPTSLFPAYFAPDNRSAMSSKDNDYISQPSSSSSTDQKEFTGLTTNAQKSDNETVQRNGLKYVNRAITAEAMTASGNAGPWANCVHSMIVPMTYNRGNIEAGIDAMAAYGNTVIPEGLAWGQRAISPSEPFTKVEGSASIPASTIAPYHHEKWRKVMVLMTDGDNDISAGYNSFNGSRYSGWGYGNEPLALNRFGVASSTFSTLQAIMDQALLDTCTAIKGNDVELYVTSFGSGISQATRDRLTACASDSAHYYHSNAPADLVAFFDHIATETVNKMIFVSK